LEIYLKSLKFKIKTFLVTLGLGWGMFSTTKLFKKFIKNSVLDVFLNIQSFKSSKINKKYESKKKGTKFGSF